MLGTLDALVQEKLSADTEFQANLANLSDEDKEAAIATKTAELREVTFKEISESAARAAEIAENQKKRAEKAETELKGFKKTDGEQPADNKEDPALSPKDMFALQQANIHLDDFDYVVNQAKLLGGIQNALKDADVQAVLEKRTERRKTAQAANVRTTRPSVKTQSDADVLEQARQGKVPEKGSPEAEALYRARRGIKQ